MMETTETATAAEAAPQCPHCGSGDLAGRGAYKTKKRYRCRACGRSSYGEPLAKPDCPPCPHCGSAETIRRGWADGKQRYLCHACHRRSFGAKRVPPSNPCPYCGGRCIRHGRSVYGHPFYICLTCRRCNTELMRQMPPPEGGPFVHQVKFCLNRAAELNLVRYCNATGLNVPRAVRAILWEAGRQPLAVMASGRRVYDAFGRVKEVVVTRRSIQGKPEPVGTPFHDLRPDAARKMAKQTGESWHAPTVLVTCRITVLLDDAAKQGLLRTMRKRRVNHQEAARFLLANARVPQ